MLGASNDFYNFMLDSYYIFKKEDGVSLKRAWAMYDTYNQEAKVAYPYSRRAFREELMNYFSDYKERAEDVNGERVRSYYSGFKYEKFKEFWIPRRKQKNPLRTLGRPGLSSKSGILSLMIFARIVRRNMRTKMELLRKSGRMSEANCPGWTLRGYTM